MGLLNGRPLKKKKTRTAQEVVDALKAEKPEASFSYRDQSLKIHGMICAKCAREFDEKDRRLLTVHHKDNNPRNNPADGSNWENLCLDCHDDEHSRGMLGDYLKGK